MATIVLSAAGAALGASVGGGLFGLSSVVIGRAIGATLGRAIDQRLMGVGSSTVETGQVEHFRLTGASEGTSVAQVYGRMRVGGQVIWATKFLEHTESTSAGKGTSTTITEYSYSVSLAVALCEGEISRVGRIWADGNEIDRSTVSMRVYSGSEDQLPDAKIEAVEGVGNVPAYRGMAYVVFEDLDLTPFGNRVPQFTFEVMRPDQSEGAKSDLTHLVPSVAMIPGTGEYALATEPVYVSDGAGTVSVSNMNSVSGETDFITSLSAQTGELPNCKSTSLVVSWFGDDLRCGTCTIQPKVEQDVLDGDEMKWSVSGLNRTSAALVPRDDDGNVIYGGTPTDQSVVQAIQALRDAGQEVMFYPFILMDQQDGNDLMDPWSGEAGQPALPWRGRITTSRAPGVAGSTDGTVVAGYEVAAFFGSAQVSDFTVSGDTVRYTGAEEFSYRRMILHYAHLCALAGGVDAFCIGSEMRSLTQIRDADGFPAVDQLIQLAADVRTILGAGTKIGYAADWSEYFGYQADGNLYFHLDPLWADEEIDFIGIDNYMPLSDWRDGNDHADAAYGSIYNLDYLKANIEGGEGYDWYYAHAAHDAAQIRTPITDDAHGEPWVWRYKDIRNWWENAHHERIDGVRSDTATPWVPQSKPVWFTEFGCAAIDKGTNEPNKFLDAKSSESALPRYSSGRRDDFIQLQYIRAMVEYWGEAAHNPVSDVYRDAMIDMSRAHVWAWDARPYPAFPSVTSVWSDGENYSKGHWLNGRSTARSLADVVTEICARSGVTDIDTSELWGIVRGYSVSDVASARSALQPLMLAFGFEAIERDGRLIFRSRDGKAKVDLTEENFAISEELDGLFERTRAPEAEVAGRVQLTFVDADADYEARAEEAIFPDEHSRLVSQSQLPLALTRSEGRQIVERWLSEARIARDTARFSLPPSHMAVGAGDVVTVETDEGQVRYRIDHATLGSQQQIDAVRVEPEIYEPSDAVEEIVEAKPFSAPVPVYPLFLDLPLMTGSEVPHAPHVAVTADPWLGSAAVYGSASDSGYALNTVLSSPSTIGVTLTDMAAAKAGVWDRGPVLRVKLTRGQLSSAAMSDVLNGANLAAIGDGSAANWELFQFANAELVGPKTYDLSLRLRGQAGTDGLEASWPTGSRFLLINGAMKQLDLALSTRGLARHYRIGPATRAYDDPSYLHYVEAFDGIGLRPYAPAHLKARTDAGGDTQVNWVRRTRVDGDSWQSVDVPLGEASESYLLRIVHNGAVKREVTLSSPAWTYTSAMKTGDGVTGAYDIHVAQMSESFGPGLFKRIEINE
ncbi:baseplate multidomain protein megatron [Celeribacter litoreus]|uniref:baseplate multidomain protein megatron n=1 Tax=Celeribacter litoreus TaxID=2876714 RepID=UPI001CCB038E|nr:glycoside hydrolase TIM-barrel-like domain-containing protein [Celeribacter litoreus]MCA0044708.1 glycoside hydrolase TIM-barrel-like domain-containing protein [Celeribacter litoreus]